VSISVNLLDSHSLCELAFQRIFPNDRHSLLFFVQLSATDANNSSCRVDHGTCRVGRRLIVTMFWLHLVVYQYTECEDAVGISQSGDVWYFVLIRVHDAPIVESSVLARPVYLARTMSCKRPNATTFSTLR